MIELDIARWASVILTPEGFQKMTSSVILAASLPVRHMFINAMGDFQRCQGDPAAKIVNNIFTQRKQVRQKSS